MDDSVAEIDGGATMLLSATREGAPLQAAIAAMLVMVEAAMNTVVPVATGR